VEENMAAERTLLVLGLGNVLCGDDGLGVAAIEELARRYRLPPDVTVLDGGTLGLDLLGALGEARAAVLVDAVAAPDCAPGTPVRLEGDDAELAVGERLSPHQIGVADLLAAARLIGCHPETLVLVGLVPASTELGIGCSPPVAAALPALVARVAAECGALGYALEERA
jgi:hydrogenase maturation protease